MQDLFKIVSIIGGIALAGLLVCLLNIRKAMVVGMGVAWLAINVLFILSLTELKQDESIVSTFLTKSGMSCMTLALVSFYYFCVVKNKEYIEDGLMPDLWYLFSYFVVVCTGVNIACMVKYFEKNDTVWNTGALLGGTFLFAFIVIEWIICTYYRTDGFQIR